jgi:nucleotide-binding universal stress UspA family protein
MYKTILVPVDGSRHGDRAVDAAIQLAVQNDGAILLLHVIRNWSLPREILDMIKAGEVQASRQEIMQQSAEIILEDARTRCANAGVPAVSAEYLTGDPATVIADYAKQKGADLIVIGHSGLEVGAHPELMGGVARKLVNITPVSCLVVR